MPSRLRPLLLLLAALFTGALVAGCGGGEKADSGTDVDKLLQQTFSGDKKIESGKLDLNLRVEAKGTAGADGPVTVKLSGPFQSQGSGKLPKFDIDASFEGAGQSLKAGIASTGEKAFVNFQGQEYAVTGQVFQQFKAGFEQAQKESGKGGGQSLATLGIDPRRWLKDAKNEGEAKVGDADTIKITGGVDVPKLLDDVNTALGKARGLGVQGSQGIPEKLTDEQKRQATEAIKGLAVEIYTGKDDSTLRRMVVDADVQAPAGSNSSADSANFRLDFSLLDLNEDQEISEPQNAKPFDQLLGSLGGLGLGGLGSGGSSGSGSSGSGSGSSGSGASADDLKKYSDCVEQAGSDVEKARKCADLLAP